MYFITGATGLVGSTIVKALAIKGERIKIFHRPESDLSILDDVKGKIIKVEGRLNDAILLSEELKDVHTIIHAAALVSFAKKDEQEIYETNVLATQYLIDAALENKVEKFVFISSIAAIGRKKNSLNVNENSQWVESSLNSAYGKSKHLAELEVWRGFEEGLKGFILNPSIILGKGDWAKSSTKLIKFIYKHQSHYPNALLNFVDLRDVRDVLLKLLNKNIEGERYILNGGQHTYKEFFNQASDLMSITKVRRPVSIQKLQILQKLAAFQAFITRSQPLVTKETVTALKYSFQYDTSKIKKEIDFEFRELQNTLEDIIPYYIDRYKL